jgi:hypothetical protein
VRADVHASEDQLVESSLNREEDRQPTSPDEPPDELADHQTRVKTLQLELDPLPDVETTVTESTIEDDQPNSDLQNTRLPWSLEGLRKAQREDPDIGFIILLLESNEEKSEWDSVALQSKDVKTLWTMWPRLALRNGLLKRRFEEVEKNRIRWQIVWPKSLKAEFLSIAHSGMAGGHLGAKRRSSGHVQSLLAFVIFGY